MGRPALLLLALALGTPAGALDATRFATGRLFVEQPIAGRANGVRLVPAPGRLRRGQSVVVLVAIRGNPRGAAFVISAVPDGLSFLAADGRAELSIDGGRRFGRLPSLTATDDGRRAHPDDVTHVRWRLTPLERAPSLTFRSRVR